MVKTREREARILATLSQGDKRDHLLIDKHYGSPQSFWATAKAYGLATQQEYDEAMRHYGDQWYYRGD